MTGVCVIWTVPQAGVEGTLFFVMQGLPDGARAGENQIMQTKPISVSEPQRENVKNIYC